MYKYVCLKTHSCSCRVHDPYKVVTKMVISADPEPKVPIKMLFPYRYNKWFLKQLDSLDHSGKVLTEEKVEYGSNFPPQECRLCTFSFNSHKFSKWPFS